MPRHRAPVSPSDQKRALAYMQHVMKLRDAAKALSDRGIAAAALAIVEDSAHNAYRDSPDDADPEWLAMFHGDISRAIAASPELHPFFAEHGIDPSMPMRIETELVKALSNCADTLRAALEHAGSKALKENLDLRLAAHALGEADAALSRARRERFIIRSRTRNATKKS